MIRAPRRERLASLRASAALAAIFATGLAGGYLALQPTRHPDASAETRARESVGAARDAARTRSAIATTGSRSENPDGAATDAATHRAAASTQHAAASASWSKLSDENSPTAAESAAMFAAEPALIDALEDLDSADPAIRAEAERYIEQLDFERLRKNVTNAQP